MKLLFLLLTAMLLSLPSDGQIMQCSSGFSQGRLVLHDSDLPPKLFSIEKLTLSIASGYIYSLEPLPQDWDLRVANHSDGDSTITVEDRSRRHPLSRAWLQDLDIQICRSFAPNDQIDARAQVIGRSESGEQKTLPYGNMSFSFAERQARRRLRIPPKVNP